MGTQEALRSCSLQCYLQVLIEKAEGDRKTAKGLQTQSLTYPQKRPQVACTQLVACIYIVMFSSFYVVL